MMLSCSVTHKYCFEESCFQGLFAVWFGQAWTFKVWREVAERHHWEQNDRH